MSDRKFNNPGFGIICDLEDEISRLQGELDKKDIAIGKLETQILELRGHIAGDTCLECNWLERSLCFARKEALQSELERYKTALGQACVSALQEDYSIVDELARIVIITFDKDNIIATLPKETPNES